MTTPQTYAVATGSVSRDGVVDVRLHLLETDSPASARTEAALLHQATTGFPADAVTCAEAPLPPMASWLKAACINPQVGATFLSGVLGLLCVTDGERSIPSETSGSGDGPVARFWAGLATAERAWREFPVHNSDAPYEGATDGH